MIITSSSDRLSNIIAEGIDATVRESFKLQPTWLQFPLLAEETATDFDELLIEIIPDRELTEEP